jgi:diguanylate cyclase (GGDEF)-like protein/PAS domain S-box-containing protein
MRFRAKDGNIVWGYTNFSIVLDSSDRPVHFLVYIRDITEQRRTQEQLRLAAQVFEGIGESIIISDTERRILSVNRAFTQITGYTLEEVRGQHPSMFRSDKHETTFYDALWQAVEKNGYWQGEVWSRKRSGEVYPQWISITAVPDEVGKTKHFISIANDISARKSAEERIHYLAHFDLLTDLPNRVLLQDRMSQAIAAAERDREEIAILFIDLDRFKQINDSLGHPVGDRVLKTVAERIKRCIRDSDTGARLGGDEFVVVLPKTGAEGAAHVAQKIQESLSDPFLIGTHKLSVTPSIGMSIYPHDGTELHTLIKNADSAVYRAKELGRNNFQFFTHTMTRAAFESMMVENGLRQAITDGDLVLHYQPQLELATGRIIGAEALVRWNRPGKGLSYPDQFIHIAEDAGLIVPIGKWVVAEACRQNAQWLQMGLSPGRVAVNLSAVQFRNKGFSKYMAETLQETGLDATYLDIELTESVVMEDIEKSVLTMKELAAMGISLSIDDFGTGYSSLYYLKRLPLHKLKIDRTFVQDCAHDSDDAAIVHAVISLAHSLRLMVLAEGVENAEQLNFLATHRCDALQGYYFSKPLSAEAYTAYLSNSGRAKTPALARPVQSIG